MGGWEINHQQWAAEEVVVTAALEVWMSVGMVRKSCKGSCCVCCMDTSEAWLH